MVLIIIIISVAVYADDYIDEIIKELTIVERYFNNAQYKKARVELDKITKKTGINDLTKDFGMEYPENIRRTIKYWDNSLKDKDGYFNSFPKFTGTVTEAFGNTAGYFYVQRGKEKKSFIYDGGLLRKGDDLSAGKKVTVYYDDFGPDNEFYQALKVEVH